MAIIKACSVKNNIKNTGKECDTSMKATAMLIAIKRGLTFTQTDLDDPIPWIERLIHDRLAFPLFGQNAPIRTITNDAEADIIVTMDDGLKVFLRYGIYNRTFETLSGGFCYASALQSFLDSGYSLLEIDQTGQLLARKNDDGTFSGFISDFMYAPSPIMADFKTTPYKNRFQISYSPVEIVNNGIIFQGAQGLLSKMGLIDADIFKAGTATTTHLVIGVRTECAEEDLVESLGVTLGDDETNFVVENSAGNLVAITSSSIVNGNIVLVGTFVSGQTYHVYGATPAVWYANDIEGYDASLTGSDGVYITIP